MATRSIDMPAIGLEPGEKPARASFKPADVFDRLLEVQGGSRVAWCRVLRCPCTPTDRITDAPKKSCPFCHGDGWRTHRPEHYRPPVEAGQLTALQTAIIEGYNAVVIEAFMSDMRRRRQPLTESGESGEGSFKLTVRHENRLNHYDRVVLLDSLVIFDEVREVLAGEIVLPLRYKAESILTLTTSEGAQLRSGVDFTLKSDGIVELAAKAKSVRRFGCLYNTHPVARVSEHLHLARASVASAKAKPKALLTPAGNPIALPIQVSARLEWLL